MELNVRNGRVYGGFSQSMELCGIKHISVAHEVKCYRAYVLPILLFGSETWALTKEQSFMLERVRTSCLSSVPGGKLFSPLRVRAIATGFHSMLHCFIWPKSFTCEGYPYDGQAWGCVPFALQQGLCVAWPWMDAWVTFLRSWVCLALLDLKYVA